MQPEHQNRELWLQYGAHPGDTAPELLRKQQMLRFIKQAISLYINRVGSQQVSDVATTDQRDHLAALGSCQNQQNSDVLQKLRIALPASQHQHEHSQQHQQQHQEHEQITINSPVHEAQPEALQEQPQHHQQLLVHQQHSSAELLARLLRPTTAGCSDNVGAVKHTAGQQAIALQHQEQQQQVHWIARKDKRQPTSHQPQHKLLDGLLQQQQQQHCSSHRPQQHGGRKRLLPQAPSKLAQQQQNEKLHIQGSLQPQVQHDHMPQVEQQPWLQSAHALNDAQSQAAGFRGSRGLTAPTAAACGVLGSSRPSSTLHQLFSPRTATHSPQEHVAVCGQQHRAGDDMDRQHDQHRTPPGVLCELPPSSDHHHQQQLPPDQLLQDDHEHDLKSPQQQHQVPVEAAAGLIPGIAAAAVAAVTPSACQMIPGTPCSEGPGPPEAAAAIAAAAAAADGAGMFSSDLYLLGSVVAESPAVPDSAMKGQGPTLTPAAAGVEGSVVQQLFTVAEEPSAANTRQQQQQSPIRLQVDPQEQQQLACEQQQGYHRQYDRVAQTWPSNSFRLHQHQQRVMSIDVSLPVVSMLTGQQQCLVVMQQGSSSRYELLHLSLQQQQGAVEIQIGCLARMTSAAAATASPAATASGMQILPLLSDSSSSSSIGDPKRCAGLFLAALCKLHIHSAGSNNQEPAHSPPPPPPAAAAAVTPATSATGIAAAGARGSAAAGSSHSKGRASLRSLTHSSGKKKTLLGRRAAVAAVADSPKAEEQHGVNIYHLRSACQQPQQQQQQQEGSVVLLQRLRTAAAVTCLAVCERSGLLAAAGASGFACVWRLLPTHDGNSGGGFFKQQQQQQQGYSSGCVDENSMMLLPAAAYRGISFPDISDLCIMQQPCSSSSDTSNARVLLVGCCSQGSVAVWDVHQQQQIIAVHSPDINIHKLFPLQPRSPLSTSRTAAAAVGDGAQQQHESDEVLLLLSLMATRDACPAAAVTPPAPATGGPRPLSRWQQQQQQPQLELCPVLLQQPGLLVPGSAVLAGVQQQQQETGSVLAAAVDGMCMSAVVAPGMVGVWDIITGRQIMQAHAADTGDDLLSVGMVMFDEDYHQQQQQQRRHGIDDGPMDSRCSLGVVVVGSAQGKLTLALI